jgi:hypothetical protein
MGIALVDLSHRSTDGQSEGYIRYAGKNDTSQIFVASLAKLAVMFAAYHLLGKVQQAVWDLQCKKEEVWAKVTAAWKPLVSTKVPGLPQDFPKLERIFDLNGSPGSWDVSFTGSNTSGALLGLLHEKHRDANGKLVNLDVFANTIGFLDRLTWAVGYHENVGATSCINDLGQQYIHGALMSEGLCDTERRGLWLGGDYSGRAFLAAKGGTIQSATAAAVADFLTRLETDQLLSSEANAAMIRLMQLAGSWFGLGLRAAGRTPTSIYNRVGQQTQPDASGNRFTTSADVCAVIERGALIRYAAVGLGAANEQVLADLIVKLDDVMQQQKAQLYSRD